MTGARRRTLRREILVWYSVVLLVALSAVTGLTFLLLKRSLESSVRTSLQQSAQYIERMNVPPGMAKVETRQDIFRFPGQGVELLRRRTLLANGATAETWLWRSDEAEKHALHLFLLISALLIPLTAIAAAAGGRALLDWLLAPLDRLVTATREIGIAGLSRRVSETEQPAELQDLARAFNEMLTRLERAVQALSRFTADASHELRTPLTSIRGTVQVTLARERTQMELEETLGEVLEETEWMLHLIDGLLTLARGEEGKVLVERTRVDLRALLEDVGEVGEALALGKPVELRLELEGGLEVSGSAGPLRQVFLNLVSNAVKFTESGTVAIRGRRRSDPPAGGSASSEDWVEVQVEDTGVGITPEELPRVFDRFYRGVAALGRPAGTGLGLAIARLIVEQHGGRIEVSSEPGLGSRFTVLLPVAPAEEHAAEAMGELPPQMATEGREGE
ncbi:MAG: HAMP domain-containing protein [Gemmatimonadetes bacterium]|nr:HAMP domain-containing protein [Gemmatimonadota bacterium]